MLTKFKLKKSFVVAAGGWVILFVSAVCGYKFYNNIKTKFDSDKLMIASLYEAYNVVQKGKIDSAEYHVLFLGNSITHHAPASTIPGADPFW